MLKNLSITGLQGAVAYYIYFAVTAASLLITTNLISSEFGPSGYSTWSLVYSFLPFFLLFDCGINSSITHIVGKKIGQKQTSTLQEYYSTFLIALFSFIFCMLVFGLAFAALALPALNVGQEDLEQVRNMFAILATSCGAQLVANFFNAIIYGHNKVVMSRVLLICQQGSFATFALLFIHTSSNPRLELILVAHLVANCVTLALTLWQARYFLAAKLALNANVQLFSKATFTSLFPFSLRVLLANVASRLNFGTDHIIIAVTLGLVDLGAYDIALKLCFYSTYLASAVSYTTFPKFASKFFEPNSDSDVQRLFLQTQTLSVQIGVCSILLLLMTAADFTVIWVGEDLVLDQTIFYVILTMNFVHVFSGPSANFLTAVGQNRELIRCEILCAALKILLSVLFSFEFGLIGVPLGTILAAALTSGWYLPMLACRTLKLSSYVFYARSTLVPFVMLIFCSILIIFFNKTRSLATTMPDFVTTFFLPVLLILTLCSLVYLVTNRWLTCK